nr:hypothetical protein [Escherichia coli]
MKAVNENDFRELIEAKQFNGYTLVSGEDWQIPTAHEILLVRGLIPLTDIQAVGQLDVSQGDKAPDQQDFVGRGYLPVFSADQRIAIKLFSLNQLAEIIFVNGFH